MKRLIFPLLLLILLACMTVINVFYLRNFTSDLIIGLERAQVLAEQGDTEGAYQLTVQTESFFCSRSLYLHVTLFHTDIDEMETAFSEVLSYLSHGEASPAYLAANAKLLTKLRLLSEGEQLTLENVF